MSVARTQALEKIWPRYYERGFKPRSGADKVRHALLQGKTIGPFLDASEGARISGIITTLERLGYRVARVDDAPSGRMTYQIENVDHRPTAAQFAAVRSSPSASASTNGSGPKRSVRHVAPMLPRLGEDLTVTALGFSPEGTPFLVVTGPDGWRYSCSVDAADAPRS